MGKITTEQRREWGMQGYLKRCRQIQELKERAKKAEREYFAWQESEAAKARQEQENAK